MPRARSDIRNVAIVAHVDHGKTTLVDALLRQTGAFRAHQELVDRVMDSTDLEREKGITILAKNTAIRYGGVKINIVDTPGHADFGGEVERGLTMVDGILLLVDAAEGPLPQTRFVLRKALEARLPVIVVVNKVDRSDARVAEVVHEIEELFLDLDADEHQIDFPIVYCNARAGRASLDADDPDLQAAGRRPATAVSSRCSSCSLEHVPAPEHDPDHPLQALVTNLDASPYVGRLALCRVRHGTLRRGAPVAWCRADGTVETVKITELYLTEALDRVDADEAGPGRDRRDRRPRRRDHRRDARRRRRPAPAPGHAHRRPEPVDDHRHQHLAARRQGGQPAHRPPGEEPPRRRARRQRVAARAARPSGPTRGRCRAAASSSSRCSSRRCAARASSSPSASPRSSPRRVDGKVHEPVDRVAIDVPEEHLGTVTQMLAVRKGRLEQMVNHGTGWVRMEYLVPARALVGLPHRVPHRDPRHRAAAPGVRGLRAVARRAAHPHAPGRWWPTGAG